MLESRASNSPPQPAPPAASGLHLLPDGAEAFAARAALAASAERTIDAQYYIWHPDLVGTLLFAQLVRAAERGVRVRLLLDDNNTSGLDAVLAALDNHPNIEVRLFNPFRRRWARALDYLLDFSRVNRRMHHKSFSMDNRATILGGRNVGDEYFGAGSEVAFEDLDVLAVGDVVAAVTRVFEEYWNCDLAVPITRLTGPARRKDFVRIAARAREIEAGGEAACYVAAVRQTSLVQELLAGNLGLEWAPTLLVSDPPSKVLAHRRTVVAPVRDRLREVLAGAKREVDIVSPYFVPTEAGVALLRSLRERGVRVRVLTNSLAATDVAAVHAGYARYRLPLLDLGVELYELTPAAAGLGTGKRGARGGSSGASLHAKTFAVDRTQAYVGSFNFDPRSAILNTEMGLLIQSPAIASTISDVINREVPSVAYQVKLADGGLEWNIGDHRYHSDPAVGIARRIAVQLLSLLPIERFL